MRWRSFSKFLLLTLCAVFLSGCIDEEYYTPLSSEPTTKNIISADEAYDAVLNNLLHQKNETHFDGYVDFDDADKIMKEIKEDHPEIFWINGHITSSADDGTTVTTSIIVDVLNDYKAGKLETMFYELKAAAEKLVNEIPEGLDDFEKIVFVHDNIISNTVYDHEGADAKKNGIWGTAYGCLVDGKATCKGYAEGFEYIMKLLDIPCETIGGSAWGSGPNQGNGEPVGHAWNYVTINGKSYWIDLTWDDPDEEAVGSPALHAYCLIDDERLMRTRTIDPDQKIPSCYSMDDNYFVRRGAYVTLYSSNSIGQILANSADSGEFEMMFADENTYNEALKMLFRKGELWELSDYAYIADNVTYTGDSNMYTLKIANIDN